MISIPQCRAARGLLNWTQQDLADASGLSKTAINNFEKGNSDIKSESLRAIEQAFEKGGVTLGKHDGVRRKVDQNIILQGPMALTELLHDILDSIHPGDEILFLNADTRKPSPSEIPQVNLYLDELNRLDIPRRIICAEKTVSQFGTIDSTRWLPARQAELTTSHIIYGKKTATLIWHSDVINIIESNPVNEAERARFEALWTSAQNPTAKEQAQEKTA